MRYKCLVFSILSIVVTANLMAQGPGAQNVWIGNGKVRARITPTGIHRNTDGGFVLEYIEPPINLLSHLTLCAGGLDPGFNIKLAWEMNDPVLKSDWEAGFRGISNSGKVWKVTNQQIQAHLSDYQDNGIVDNPILEIFAWPAHHNPFSVSINGFSTDSIHPAICAPFFDEDGDGVYNPENGDFPLEQIGYDPRFFPEEMTFSPFFDNGENKLSGAGATHLDMFFLAFTLGCREQEFVENTIFFEYGGFLNAGFDRLDSLFLGIYADFDIGDPGDDYLGCIPDPSNEIIYAYNSDTLFDHLAGSHPPIVSLNCFNTIIDENDICHPLANFIPIFPNNFPGATHLPGAPYEYYNYLTGSWKDGSPIRTGGIGYNPGGFSTPVPLIFPDNPTDPNGWSELSEQNPMGNRKCIASYGPISLLPYGYNRSLKFALTASDKPGLTQQLQNLTEMRDLQRYIFDYCWDCPSPLDSLCNKAVPVKALNSMSSIVPNPTHGFISLKTPGIDISRIELLNALGQKVSNNVPSRIQENDVLVNLQDLPPGIYFLHWLSRDGRQGCERVVKE